MQVDSGRFRRMVHERLLETTSAEVEVDRALVASVVEDVAPLLDRPAFDDVVAQVLADVHGLGPLEPLFDDNAVTDIMVVGGRGVWVESNGRITDPGIEVTNAEVFHLIERIVAPLGLRVDRSSPMVDARLKDGSRVNAIVPPLAVDGPCLTIRRFGARNVPLADIAHWEVAELLRAAVAGRRNILVSGGTGAGKTTLLNALAAGLETHERVITVEDAAELRLPLRHVVRLEGRSANSEGIGNVTQRELLRNALRMRPDRIIIGEVRGAEALDMIQAMNTGHEGSMSTCHANSPADALRRVETMVLMSDVALPLAAIRQQVVSSIDLVVQISRLADGGRRVVDVSEVDDSSSDVPTVRQIADINGVIDEMRRPGRELQTRETA